MKNNFYLCRINSKPKRFAITYQEVCKYNYFFMRTQDNIFYILFFSVLLTIYSINVVYGKDNISTKKIYFIKGYSKQNETNKNEFDSLYQAIKSIENTHIINKITINSFSSPEGQKSVNLKLSQQRTESVTNFLKTSLNISDSIITEYASGVDWQMLRELIKNSLIDKKTQLLDIIDNVEEETWVRQSGERWLVMTDSRNRRIGYLNYGKTFAYLDKNIYPQMRFSKVTIYSTPITKKQEIDSITVVKDTIRIIKKQQKVQIDTIQTIPSPQKQRKELFTLKTNLLADAATIINIGIEAPISRRWSVEGNFYAPWWRSTKKEFTLQMLS